MPVVAVNLSAAVFAEISKHVASGLYTSPEQFLEIAAFNQVALERGTPPNQLSTRSSSRSGSTPPKRVEHNPRRVVVRTRAKRNPDGPSADNGSRTSRAAKGSSPSETEIRDCRMRTSVEQLGAILPSPSKPQRRAQNERLWAQFNRLFNLKFACRWLAVAHAGATDWKPFMAVVDAMSADAAVLGSALEQADTEAGRKRDELLSTGMPRVGNMASRDRFIAQTIARATRTGRIYPGAVCQYALASFHEDRLELTTCGLKLARLTNPILDGKLDQAEATLSPEERSCLLQQVTDYAPGELADFQAVLFAVRAGKATPEELIASVRDVLPADWSEQLVRTHTAGVVARLVELGLLRRHWQGRNVRYEACQPAAEFAALGGLS